MKSEAQIYIIRDRLNGTTYQAQHSVTANNSGYYPSISDDGSVIAFCSIASNLADSDTNNTWDIFAWDALPGGYPVIPNTSPPTDITLSNQSVLENLPAGTVAGALSAIDPDFLDTHSFSLVSGAGSNNNSEFTIIDNDQLTTAVILDYEAQPSYSIRVRATDSGGLTYDKAFTITAEDQNEHPNRNQFICFEFEYPYS